MLLNNQGLKIIFSMSKPKWYRRARTWAHPGVFDFNTASAVAPTVQLANRLAWKNGGQRRRPELWGRRGQIVCSKAMDLRQRRRPQFRGLNDQIHGPQPIAFSVFIKLLGEVVWVIFEPISNGCRLLLL
jgi:hypothetical protein